MINLFRLVLLSSCESRKNIVRLALCGEVDLLAVRLSVSMVPFVLCMFMVSVDPVHFISLVSSASVARLDRKSLLV